MLAVRFHTRISITLIWLQNDLYGKNLLKCSYAAFQGREMASICSKSSQARELRNTRPGRKKKKTRKKRLWKILAPKKLLLLLNYFTQFVSENINENTYPFKIYSILAIKNSFSLSYTFCFYFVVFWLAFQT